jgi:hypothetical protein
VRRVAPLAVAASLILGIAIAAILFLNGRGDTDPVVVVEGMPQPGPAPVTLVQIAGPEAPEVPEAGDATVLAQVEIGPSPQFAARESQYFAAEAVVSQPSRVIWIASGGEPAQDGRYLPY